MKKYFKEGIVHEIEYDPEYSENSLSNEQFFPNSNRTYLLNFAVDTVIITDGNPITCNTFIIYYFETGAIKQSGYFGTFYSQEVPVGLHSYYDSLGTLLKTQNFIYPKQKENITRNDAFTYIIECEYYDNKKPKWEKRYENYIYYEVDENEKKAIGYWKYYNEQGELIKNEKHFLDKAQPLKNLNIQPYKVYFDEEGGKIEKYGNQSFTDSIIVYYPNGQLSLISYFSKEPVEGMILNKSFYKNGNLFSIEMLKDTTFLIDNKKIKGLYELYYENGRLKYRGYKGDSGYNVGLWIYYDSLGVKTQERICFPSIEDPDKSYVEKRELYPNGNVKKIWRHRYFDEAEIPIGVTKYYNEQGELIRKEN